jgi:acyl-CoA reductase-like NAD-dependent aldehyde dehydrogenase
MIAALSPAANPGREHRALCGRNNQMNVQLLIGNEDVAAANAAVFERRDPITGAVVTRAAAASVADAGAAAEAASAAFHAWSQTGPNARRAFLLQAADSIERRSQDFIASMMAETGATPTWGAFNVRLAAIMFREAAAMTTQITGEVIPSDQPGCLAFSVREPVGVVLGIAPWNAPVILGARAIALPLACGNTVVLKSSELCPATQYLLGAVTRDAGFPAGVINVISNAPEAASQVVESLIAHRAVRRISFTGSTRVGRIVAAIAARHLKPVLLELGGKAPMIVLGDADLDDAVRAAVFGAFMNQGQICMSTERIVVQQTVADEFVLRLAHKTESLRCGNPQIDGIQIGSLIGLDAGERVEGLIREAVSKGARVLVGGAREATVMRPTVLDGVRPDMKIYYEESFGPVVSVVRVTNDEEAIRIANDTQYGLTASVFSRNIPRALGIARQLQTGMCHINGATVHDEAQMPFGGVKESGYGRFGGRAGIDEFTELRWITINTTPPHYPI